MQQGYTDITKPGITNKFDIQFGCQALRIDNWNIQIFECFLWNKRIDISYLWKFIWCQRNTTRQLGKTCLVNI